MASSDNYHLSLQVSVGPRKSTEPVHDPRSISLSTSALDLLKFEDSPASSSPLLDSSSSSSSSRSSVIAMGAAPLPPSPSPSPPPVLFELVSSPSPSSPMPRAPSPVLVQQAPAQPQPHHHQQHQQQHRASGLTSSSTPDITRGSPSAIVLTKPATDVTKGLAQGFLWMKKLASWARYWFVLQADGLFTYYSSRFFSPENRKGAILLLNSQVELGGSALVFIIRTTTVKHPHHKAGKSFQLRSDSPEARQIWVSQLQRFLAGERQFLPGTQRPASVSGSVRIDATPTLFSETYPAGDEPLKKKKSAAPTWVDY